MTDKDNSNENKISLSPKKTLSLKGKVASGSAGGARANSGGRGKSVVVEKKRRRVVTPGGANKGDANRAPGSLTNAEQGARAEALARALEQAKIDEAKAAERAIQKAKEDEEKKRIAAEKQKAEEERLKLEAEQKQQEEQKQDAEKIAKADSVKEVVSAPRPKPGQKKQAETIKKPSANQQADLSAVAAESLIEKPGSNRGAAAAKTSQTDDKRANTKKRAVEVPAKPQRTKGQQDRRRSKLTVTNAMDQDERERSLASMRRRRERNKRQAQQFNEPREKISREVKIPDAITIQELGNRMAERAVDVIKILMAQGQMLKATDTIDADTAQLIAEEMGHTVKRVSDSDVEEGIFNVVDDEGEKISRPPVVTIMGHVDHGKTSLLDALRKANVVSGEAGGITQHIGAYQVEINDQPITFIDTPGHAAFTAMRSRGAKATDIVILVVAADDSVMPQTIEAINHAKAAEVPIIVAVNKIDKPDANPSKVITDLLQHEVITETMGGDTLEVHVSAKEGTNLDKLLEAILLQSELLELKANAERSAQGLVIEAKLDKGRGPVATVLVQHGTLNQGDIVVAGAQWAKVRALIDDQGKQVQSAPPSKPVEILGFDGTPEAGDPFAVVENEARAREISEYRARKNKERAMIRGGSSLEQMMNQMATADRRELTLIVKADVQGSLEAIVAALGKAGTDEVEARIVHSGVGGITETDVTLATTTGAAILAFNVRANSQARDSSQRDGIEIRYYSVIYDLIDDVKSAMAGLLDPEVREEFIGYAEMLEIFNISKVGKVAGCRVTEGIVERGASVRLLRDDTVIHEGKLSTLKRFKDEVKDVKSGQECGMAFENYQDIRQGDVIECFRVTEHARTLD